MAKGLSGTAVAFLGIGGVIAYAGFRGVSPLRAFKDISSGKPPPLVSNPTVLNRASADSSTPIAGAAAGVAAGVVGNIIYAAAQRHMGEKYSQSRRTEPGWSDCSSFVDKVLTDVGIPPPTKWAATGNYLVSGEWQTIPLAQARAGDVAVNSAHMVLITGAGGSTAIGQQNTQDNVKTGSVAQLMGNVGYVVKRYVGKR